MILSVLDIHALTVTYGAAAAPALRAITLTLNQGQRLALIGESGSGKSTLALAVCGLLPPDAHITGTITFPTPRHLGRDIGVLFQDPSGSLNPVLTIGEQIAEVLVIHCGHSWAAARAAAARLLDRVRIAGGPRALAAYPHEFSGGQRQRIALAAALAARPTLLIADEPTSALDSIVQAELVTLLDELVREDGMSLLFVTHDIALASHLADTVAVLYRGAIVETGPIATVLNTPAHAYTRALIATRLDLDTPRTPRLAEIDPATFAIRHG